MRIDAILSRLEKVRKTGRDSWVACCPAHDDRNPSMTLRELDDGRILLHCFAGCSVEEVLASTGLSFDALVPEKPLEHGKPERRAFPASDVLACLTFELTVVSVALQWQRQHGMLTAQEEDRLRLARSRIDEGRVLAEDWCRRALGG